MDEAIKLADKICIMSEGKVIQYDTQIIFYVIQLTILLKILLVRIV